MEEKILQQFLYNEKLKFNEIEKSIGLRSNHLSYHLKKLESKNLIVKENDFYRLSKSAENIIPYLTSKKSILPVVLILIRKGNQIFLHKRSKRPYKDMLSLPGGRILLGEDIPKAVERIMKEKFNANCKLQKVNSISLEHVNNSNKETVHSYLLILVTANTKDNLPLFDIDKEKRKVIPSDYKIIKNSLNFEMNILTINSRV